jgi:hypothetical protein
MSDHSRVRGWAGAGLKSRDSTAIFARPQRRIVGVHRYRVAAAVFDTKSPPASNAEVTVLMRLEPARRLPEMRDHKIMP